MAPIKKLLILLSLGVGLWGCSSKPAKDPDYTYADISRLASEMTEVMIHDITNPPLASRFFAYTCLAGYEVIAAGHEQYKSMYGRLNDFPQIKTPDSLAGHGPKLSALLAMMDVAAKLQPSGKLIQDYRIKFLDSLRNAGVSANMISQSELYAAAVSRQILAYAKADGYNKISNYPRYTPTSGEGNWYPTPPAYMAAVEPYFFTVRSFTLDSAEQFRPAPPVPFSSKPNSDFYRMMEENYRHVLTNEEKAIAAFWDCNPFAVQDNGHLLVGLKKISPGAHWLGIAGIACKQAGKSFEETLQVFTAVSVGLMDGFICCWREKYRSNRIRPETAIRKYIDASWTPLLQTPPFPEYLSGHSTISASSAVILTRFFGDGFAYTDTVEERYGLPGRKFTSFRQAAEEAAISRFYGGIHFRDAIEHGLIQGEKVGARVLDKIGL